MTTPTYKIGDTVRTRGRLAGLTGIVTEYIPHIPGETEHGFLELRATEISGEFWSLTAVGDLEHICIYSPSSKWYGSCGGGMEPKIINSAPPDPLGPEQDPGVDNHA
jgi:hypothetical protein